MSHLLRHSFCLFRTRRSCDNILFFFFSQYLWRAARATYCQHFAVQNYCPVVSCVAMRCLTLLSLPVRRDWAGILILWPRTWCIRFSISAHKHSQYLKLSRLNLNYSLNSYLLVLYSQSTGGKKEAWPVFLYFRVSALVPLCMCV